MTSYIIAYSDIDQIILGKEHGQCCIRTPRPTESKEWLAIPALSWYCKDVMFWRLEGAAGNMLDEYENPHFTEPANV